MRFKPCEKTIFSAAILILLCINLLPILTVTAGPPPGKGKPNKGSIDILFIEGNIDGDVIGASGSLDNQGRLTFARANPPRHCPDFILEFLPDGGFWTGTCDFSGLHDSNDFQISLEWTDVDEGDISFYYWFVEDDDQDDYRLVFSGKFEYDDVSGEYSPIGLYNAEIQYQKGPGKKNYDTCWSDSIAFTFKHT